MNMFLLFLFAAGKENFRIAVLIRLISISVFETKLLLLWHELRWTKSEQG
jgi:hypothetical protein